MNEEKEYICVMDAAKILGLSKNVMYTLAKQPGFPAVRIGKKIVIRRSGLDDWMKNHEGKEVVL
jgi:excisionase family DNA binding protein